MRPGSIDTPASRLEGDEFGLSIVRNDALFRLQRHLGLIPREGLGVGRRAVFWALFAWVPVVGAAWLSGTLSGTGESLLLHYGVHVRSLLAVPLLILAEAHAHRLTTKVVPHLAVSGIVPERERGRFREVVAGIIGLRDSAWPWLAMLAFIGAGVAVSDAVRPPHEVAWSGQAPAAAARFGAWWILYVARPLYLTLVLGWFWRVALLVLLFARVSRLELALVPTHPDRAGGLAFLERITLVFAPVVVALSAVLAARWAHEVLHHGADVMGYRAQGIMFIVLAVVVFTAPLLVFAGLLGRVKKQALLDYGALTARHGRLVGDRWIHGRAVNDSVLQAPELGPLVDIGAAYTAVTHMRTVPLGKAALMPIVVAALLPMLALLALQVPVAVIVKNLLAGLL